MNQTSLIQTILRLSVSERVLLVEQIRESIVEDEASFELTDAQKQELDRRLKARASRTDSGSTWEEVKARIR